MWSKRNWLAIGVCIFALILLGAVVTVFLLIPYHGAKNTMDPAGTLIIRALEDNAAAAGVRRVVLETARTTPDSEALYLSLGYRRIDYYGSPAGAENCLCFDKELAPPCLL